MAKIRTIQFSPDEFLSGVSGLRAEDIGVYWVICSLIYSSSGPISQDDPRLRLIAARKSDVDRSVERLLAASKLYRSDLVATSKETRSDLGLMSKRCRSEIEAASKRIRRASEAGSKRGRSDTGIEQNQGLKNVLVGSQAGSANQPSQSQSQSQSISKSEPEKESATIEHKMFPDFWKYYPRKDDRAGASTEFNRAVTIIKASEIISAAPPRGAKDLYPGEPFGPGKFLCEAAELYDRQRLAEEIEDKFVPHAKKWLASRGWEGVADWAAKNGAPVGKQAYP